MGGIPGRVLAVLFLSILIASGIRLALGCDCRPSLVNFVFGDSLVDSGNNNYIISLSKANYLPNGIDFGKPTGRYTNGRTIVDVIGMYIHICYGQEVGVAGFTLPYLSPDTIGPIILQGVNYASGAGGILNETGKIFGGRINMDAQIDNFAKTKNDIISMIGLAKAEKLLENALYSVTIGSNDFVNNYLTPIISVFEQKSTPPDEYVAKMIDKLRLQLTRLYDLGARKIVVVNVGPIGCIPYIRDINPSSGDKCATFPNELARSYNAKLKTLVQGLSKSLTGSYLVYADVYRIVSDIVTNYKSYGFENASGACCHLAGTHGGLIPCGPWSEVCSDRSKYVFWDPYHPSDATNVIMAKRLLDGGIDDIWPMNVRQLAAIGSSPSVNGSTNDLLSRDE
ncbi:GDSL esterase/lipase At4g16230 [Linum perenne]